MRVFTLFFTLVFLVASPGGAESLPPGFATPEAALESYLEALEAGDSERVLQCYTASSRRMVSEHPELSKGRTPEELQASHSMLEGLTYTTEQVNEKRAILHPDDEGVPPLFLRRQVEDEGWRIDLHFMLNYIRAGSNGWSYTFPRAEQIWRSRK